MARAGGLMASDKHYDRESAAARLGVHPGSASFDLAWARLRSGEFSEGLCLDRDGRIVAASTDPDGVFRISEDDLDTRFPELMAMEPVDARKPYTVRFVEHGGRTWASQMALAQAFNVRPSGALQKLVDDLLRQCASGQLPGYRGRKVEIAHLYRENRLPIDDARWIASTLSEERGMAPEATADWVSQADLGRLLRAKCGRDSLRMARVVFDRLAPQIGGGPDRHLGTRRVIAENRTTSPDIYQWKELPFIHVTSIPEVIAFVEETMRGPARSAQHAESQPVAAVPVKPMAPLSDVDTAGRGLPDPATAVPTETVRPMGDGNMGRLVLVHEGKPWAVALGRGSGSGQDADAFLDGFVQWLGINPDCRTIDEDALCRPFVPAAEAVDAADFRATGFLPTTLVLYREEDDGEFWDAYMHGVRGTHAMAGAVSLVGEPVARRELVTAWGRNGIGLLALEDADRRTVSDVAHALNQGLLAVAASRGTGPVLVIAERVEPGTSLDAVLETVAAAQALNPNARFVRVSEPPPGTGPRPAP